MKNQITVYKWLARIIGGLAVLFFGSFFIGEGIPDLIKGGDGHLQSMMLLMGFALLGYIFAWFREKEGGYVLVFSGVIMGLTMFYDGGLKDISMTLIYSVPFIVSGLLFLRAGKSSEIMKSKLNDTAESSKDRDL
jgi:hypothetical protein